MAKAKAAAKAKTGKAMIPGKSARPANLPKGKADGTMKDMKAGKTKKAGKKGMC